MRADIALNMVDIHIARAGFRSYSAADIGNLHRTRSSVHLQRSANSIDGLSPGPAMCFHPRFRRNHDFVADGYVALEVTVLHVSDVDRVPALLNRRI